ncbi:flagellar protein FliT [Bacillus oleivorans]|uniref:Flagellar protein FliT n=1 Tax=Bacillus oleivorans TaxID=1448271 RepID=A0A285CZ93_9BACI|nr:flagellar protein FliT [Bacillus oleivorans]SNX72862.1 flagellar protein FliT [Bacillus oleivorans]
MSNVQKYYIETVQLLSFLKNENGCLLGRDERIEFINSCIASRQDLIEQIKPPYSKDEMEIGKKTIELEKELQALLRLEKQSIQKDLTSFTQHKKSRNKYINPYKSLNFDGMFYDKRK